jgi:hypothetical protein
METNSLVVELNGIKYLLFQLPVTSQLQGKKVQEKVKEFKGIVQGINGVKRNGFFGGGYVVLNLLIPEDRAIEFSNTKL